MGYNMPIYFLQISPVIYRTIFWPDSLLTLTRDTVSRVSSETCAVVRSFCVWTVSISVADVCKVLVLWRQRSWIAFINIWQWKTIKLNEAKNFSNKFEHEAWPYWEFPYINMFVGYLSVITNLRKTNSNLCFVIYFALIWNVNLTSAIFRGLYSVLHSFLKMTENVKKLTETRDSITRIPQMTGAKEGTLSVGTIGVSMAVVFKVTIIIRYLFGKTLVHIWKKIIENWIIFQYR